MAIAAVAESGRLLDLDAGDADTSPNESQPSCAGGTRTVLTSSVRVRRVRQAAETQSRMIAAGIPISSVG